MYRGGGTIGNGSMFCPGIRNAENESLELHHLQFVQTDGAVSTYRLLHVLMA
jgi:hypothetical protein